MLFVLFVLLGSFRRTAPDLHLGESIRKSGSAGRGGKNSGDLAPADRHPASALTELSAGLSNAVRARSARPREYREQLAEHRLRLNSRIGSGHKANASATIPLSLSSILRVITIKDENDSRALATFFAFMLSDLERLDYHQFKSARRNVLRCWDRSLKVVTFGAGLHPGGADRYSEAFDRGDRPIGLLLHPRNWQGGIPPVFSARTQKLCQRIPLFTSTPPPPHPAESLDQLRSREPPRPSEVPRP